MQKFPRIAMAWTVVLLLMLSAGAVSADDLNKGLMGMAWRTGAAQIGQLDKLYAKGQVEYYALPSKAALVGDVTLAKVIFGFYQNKFFSAFMEIQSESDFSMIRKYLKETFGPWKQSQTMAEMGLVYQWKSGDVKIKLKANRKSGRMKLAFYFLPISFSLNEQRMDENQVKAFEFLPIKPDKKPDALHLFTF